MNAQSGRRGWLGFLLSMLLPGVGQLYAGDPVRAAAGFGLGVVLPVFLISLGLASTFAGFVTLMILALALRLWIAFDAAVQVRRKDGEAPRPYQRWFVYLPVLITWSLLVFLLRDRFPMPVRTYHIPSIAMEPTVRLDDYLVADHTAYADSKPQRGDIVVYRHPEDPGTLALSRVIGLAGERLEIRDPLIRIDGALFRDPWASHSGMPSPLRNHLGPLTLPTGTVFLLSDNRDHAYDSRNFGPVEESEIVGRALYIYWAVDRDRIGTRLTGTSGRQ